MKKIPGFENYSIDEDGRVFSHLSNSFLKPFQRSKKFGHLCVNLVYGKSGTKSKFKTEFVHRLVLETFAEKRKESQVCRHIDGNPKNNHISNLRWGSQKENCQDKMIHGTHVFGSKNGNSKLTESDVISIRNEFQQIGRKKNNAKQLSDKYQIHEEVIKKIVFGDSWGHLKEGIQVNLYKNLTKDDVLKIRKDYCFNGWQDSNSNELAKKYNVSVRTILQIASGKTWRHI